MELNDFAKYVIDNMHRASLNNALNITDKVLKEYNSKDFCNAIISYMGDQGYVTLICRDIEIVKACYDFQKNIELDKVNEKMILDNLIIEIWEAINGH